MNALRFLMLASLLALTGCGSGSGSEKGRLDRRTQDILANADRVEVFRIDGLEKEPEEEPTATNGPKIDGFPIISTRKDQGKEFARRLGEVLSDDQISKEGPKCFWPGVAFRVRRGEDCIDVLLCFKCDNFYCGPATKDIPRETGSFGNGRLRSRLLQLAKEAFPDDKDIQALQDK
ncbi:MAG: hypothetical protein HYS12_06290 [Planctomycetes bacterium]|nr:hypothetical protein [Planctomycetota bacterium]